VGEENLSAIPRLETCVTFVGFTPVTIKTTIFWDLTPCTLEAVTDVLEEPILSLSSTLKNTHEPSKEIDESKSRVLPHSLYVSLSLAARMTLLP
jgi:hypothetical protein